MKRLLMDCFLVLFQNFIQNHFDGVGICAVNLVDDMQEYMRGLFIVM
jgi:hypothetical protein